MSIKIERIQNNISNFKTKILSKKSDIVSKTNTTTELISSKVSAAISAIAMANPFKDEISEYKIKKSLKKCGYKMHIEKNNFGYTKQYTKDLSEKSIKKIHDAFKDFKYKEWEKPLDIAYINDVKKGLSESDITKIKNILQSDKNLGNEIFNNNFENFINTFVLLPKSTIHDMQINKNIFKMVNNISKLSPDINHYHAVCMYQGHSRIDGHLAKRAQDALRSGKEITENDVRRYISTLEKMINSQTVPEDLTLYRGEGYQILKNIELENGKKIDLAKLMKTASYSKNQEKINKIREFVLDNEISTVQPAFMSTSYKQEMPLALRDGILWEITPEKGTKGLLLDALNIKDTSLFGNKNEEEILLQKGSKLKIKDLIYNNKQGYWRIFATVSN